MTTISTTTRNVVGARVTITAQHLYDAECALHAAHQSHVEAWITAAAERLHDAIAEYLAAVADQTQPQQPTVDRWGGD